MSTTIILSLFTRIYCFTLMSLTAKALTVVMVTDILWFWHFKSNGELKAPPTDGFCK